MKQQTAVEWLFEQVWINPISELPKILEQAKQIEKEQKKTAYERAITNYGMPPLETKIVSRPPSYEELEEVLFNSLTQKQITYEKQTYGQKK